MKSLTHALALIALGAWCAPTYATDVHVGIPVRLTDIVIDGPEIEALPLDKKAAFEVRIVAVRPHGSAFRYDIECVALEAGEFDAASGLRRKDGSALAITPLPLTATTTLAPGVVRPHVPGSISLPRLGGYRAWMIALAVVWVVGLVWLLLLGRKRRQHASTIRVTHTETLAERLRSLVQRAQRGELSGAERAHLEMSLVAHWRRRLGLDARPTSELLPTLRAHPEAGPLFDALEEWLHAPPSGARVDVGPLLAPYQDLADDELDLSLKAAR